MIGADIALELDFAEAAAVTIETRAGEGQPWMPVGYALITRNIQRVSFLRPPATDELRLTVGIDGKLIDSAEGRVLADGSSLVIESLHQQPVAIRDARLQVQLQVRRDTITRLSMNEGGDALSTSTRPFPR
jgi:hypothetical protein